MGIAQGNAAGGPVGSSRGFDKRKVVPIFIISIACLGLLYLFDYFAPIQIASVTFYAGVVIGLAGLFCLIKPIWWLGIRSRKVAALVGFSSRRCKGTIGKI